MSEKKLPPHLPIGIAYSILGLMVAAALGQLLPVAQDISDLFRKWDPLLRRQFWGNAISVCYFLLTGAIAYKQMGYYYRLSGKKGGIFRYTIGALNEREYSIDLVLGIWGAFLFPVSTNCPSVWLGACSVYALLGWGRCIVTLRRKKYANEWLSGKQPKPWSIPWDTFPFEEIENISFSEKFRDDENKRLNILIDSLNMTHQTAPKYPKLDVKHVLAGWLWSFKNLAICSACFFLMNSILAILYGYGKLTLIVHILSIIGFAALFWGMSERSLEKGSENWGRFVE